jgi:hypothetical protein
MSLRWCESPGSTARIAALSADQAPPAIIGCPHMTKPSPSFAVQAFCGRCARTVAVLTPIAEWVGTKGGSVIAKRGGARHEKRSCFCRKRQRGDTNDGARPCQSVPWMTEPPKL